ncbi:hypothetical protein HDU86_001774 [Geranomyces michiganensis]|nr:hypothetical protein HDU86_001774 [Geranomyces michiganensis]
MAAWNKVSAEWITSYNPDEPGMSWLINLGEHLGADVVAATSFETWFGRYQDELIERSKSTSTTEEVLKKVFQLRNELNKEEMPVEYEACVHTSKAISAVCPAALAGMCLAGEDIIIARKASKRTIVEVGDCDNDNNDIVEPATPPSVAKRARMVPAPLTTPHKLVVLGETPDPRKTKHKPAAQPCVRLFHGSSRSPGKVTAIEQATQATG